MAAIQTLDQAAIQSFAAKQAADCQACRQGVASGTESTALARRTDTRTTLRLNASEVAQAFSAKLVTQTRATSSYGAVTGGDGADALASRFFGAIAGQLNAASDPAEMEQVVANARKAVAQTEDEVAPLADDDGRAVASGLADGLNRGLDNLEQMFRPAAEPSQQTVVANQTEFEHRVKGKFGLAIQTQDGDVVRLRVRLDEVSMGVSQSLSASGLEFSASQVSAASNMRLRLDVRGELDEGEMAAIKEVVSQFDGIARGLLSGDLDGVMSALTGFSFDNAELSDVAMRMRVRERLEVSMQEQRTRVLTAPAMEPPSEPAESRDSAPSQSATTPPPLRPEEQSQDTQIPLDRSQQTQDTHEALVKPASGLADAESDNPLADATRVLREFMLQARVEIKARFELGGSRLSLDQGFFADLLDSLVTLRERSTSARETTVDSQPVRSSGAVARAGIAEQAQL